MTTTNDLCQRCGQRPSRWVIGFNLRVCGPCKTITAKEPQKPDGSINTFGWHYHQEYKARFAKLVTSGRISQDEFDAMFAQSGV